jgi:nitroreductase
MGTSVMDTIRSRRSVRTYTGEPLTEARHAGIEAYLAELAQTYGVKLALLKNEYQDRKFGTYGMIKNPAAYIAAVCAHDKEALIQAGIALEKGVLRCTEMGLGTCWLGGSFNRGEFGSALTVGESEIIPAVISVGQAQEKERWLGNVMRYVAKSGQRKSYGELFFDGGFDQPLSLGNAPWNVALEMVRIGPSASNKQPWRVVRVNEALHFYLHRAASYEKMPYDMQRLDMGIAMAHFEMIMDEQGAGGYWQNADPRLAGQPERCEYITSWICG